MNSGFLLICQSVVFDISFFPWCSDAFLIMIYFFFTMNCYLTFADTCDMFLSFVSGTSFSFFQDIILIIAPYSTGNHCLEGQLSWMFSRITY
jgi:hypothetical protein